MQKRKPKIKNTSKIVGIIFAVLTIIAGCIALYFVLNKEAYDGENKEHYDRIRDEAKETPTDASINEEFVIDWEALKDSNIVAWIKYGDSIDYPVVQGEDNTYYLKHMSDGTYNAGGSIFLNAHNSSDFTDWNSIIYGHNMSTGAMFGEFKNYINQTKELPKDIYLYLPDGTKHTYRVFSINRTLYTGDAYKITFKDKDEYKEYQTEMLKTSEFDVGGVVNENKRMLTLSTCSVYGSKQGNRVVILGMEKYVKQIQEPASWYVPKQDFGQK